MEKIQTPYQKKLLDPRWQKKRLEILNRDNFSCKMCNADEFTLHIHHLSYNEKPWETEDGQLITVCKYCHNYLEQFKNNKEYSFHGGFVKRFYKHNGVFHISFFNNIKRNERFINITDISDGEFKHVGSLTAADFNKFKDFLSGK